MRWNVLFLLSILATGCTTQSTGSRCEQDSDCNTATDLCRDEVRPERSCTSQACICCPSDPVAAAAIAVCIPRSRTDAGSVTDTGSTATDTGSTTADTGSPADAGASDVAAVTDAVGSTDAGSTPDTGASTDTGARTDTGSTPTDTGVSSDTGTPTPTDAGAAPDVSVVTDT